MAIFRVKKKFRGNCVDPGEISANLRILSSLQYVVSLADEAISNHFYQQPFDVLPIAWKQNR